MKNDKNLSQDDTFDFKQVIYKIEKSSKNQKNLIHIILSRQLWIILKFSIQFFQL